MKITIKDLRKILQETITDINEAGDKELSIGDEVTIMLGNRSHKGVIKAGYSATGVDPMARGKHMAKTRGHMMWSVQIGKRVFQIPADELEIIRSKRNDASGKSDVKPNWDTDLNTKQTQEAVAISGMSTMLKGHDSDDEEPGRGGDRDDFLLDDDELNEVDEDKESEVFSDRRYDMIARQLIFNFQDDTPEVNWKKVAQNYANSKKSQTGKTIDVNALYTALVRYMETDGDERNQAIFAGTHLYK